MSVPPALGSPTDVWSVRPVASPALLQRRESLGWATFRTLLHLFVIDIADVTSIPYDANGDQYVARYA
jgi:hypothetical protein